MVSLVIEEGLKLKTKIKFGLSILGKVYLDENQVKSRDFEANLFLIFDHSYNVYSKDVSRFNYFA